MQRRCVIGRCFSDTAARSIQVQSSNRSFKNPPSRARFASLTALNFLMQHKCGARAGKSMGENYNFIFSLECRPCTPCQHYRRGWCGAHIQATRSSSWYNCGRSECGRLPARKEHRFKGGKYLSHSFSRSPPCAHALFQSPAHSEGAK